MDLHYFYQPDLNSESLDEANRHHALNVLRMRTGEKLMITDGKGKTQLAEITGLSKKDCQLRILETKEADQKTPSLHLAIAFTKNPSRMEWLL